MHPQNGRVEKILMDMTDLKIGEVSLHQVNDKFVTKKVPPDIFAMSMRSSVNKVASPGGVRAWHANCFG